MELINTKLIEINPNMNTRQDVIDHFATLLKSNKRIDDREGFLKDVYHREEEVSTSMGLGVAIPHTQSIYVSVPSLVFMKLAHPITWNEDDNIQYIFGIAMPSIHKSEQHLKILSKLARKLMDDEFRKQLSNIETKEECIAYLDFLNNECQQTA